MGVRNKSLSCKDLGTWQLCPSLLRNTPELLGVPCCLFLLFWGRKSVTAGPHGCLTELCSCNPARLSFLPLSSCHNTNSVSFTHFSLHPLPHREASHYHKAHRRLVLSFFLLLFFLALALVKLSPLFIPFLSSAGRVTTLRFYSSHRTYVSLGARPLISIRI